jgi:hypothetical protein
LQVKIKSCKLASPTIIKELKLEGSDKEEEIVRGERTNIMIKWKPYRLIASKKIIGHNIKARRIL